MAMYDPSTGKWFEYNASNNTIAPAANANDITSYNYNPSSLNQIDRPANAGDFTGAGGYYVTADDDPRNTAAALINAQFSDWSSLYKDVELNQLKQISFNNPSVLSTALGKAEDTATQSSASMSGILQRQNEKRGLNATPGQQNIMGRMMNLNTAENIASAKNTARSDVRQQDEQILSGTPVDYGKINASQKE